MKFRLDSQQARTASSRRADRTPLNHWIARAVRAAVESLEPRVVFNSALLAIADADTERSDSDTNVANANFGADPELRVELESSKRKEVFVKFDISTVTSVGSAVVQMAGGATDLLVGTSKVSIFAGNNTTWVEGNGVQPSLASPGYNLDDNPLNEIRFNNRPGSTGASLDTQVVGIAQVYSWNVTSFLQAQKAAGATIVGFVFRGTGGTGEATFQSKEVGGGAGPLLVVENDTTAPGAGVAAGNITASGGTTHTVTVTYTDNAGIDADSIGPNDIAVTGPGGAVTVSGVTVDSSNPKSVVATYTINAPGGSWDGLTDNGTYSVTVQTGEVRDFENNGATGTGSFTVNIPTDTTPPVASAFNAQPITTAGGATYTFTVTYTDNVSIATGTIGSGDVTVARNGGGANLTVTGVTTSGTGNSVSATYTVSAPGGSWDASDNGTYTITVLAASVKDTAGNNIATTTTTFQATLPDITTPVVGITPVSQITTAGITTTQITVTYTDNQAIDSSSIDSGDVTVVQDGGGALPVTLISKSSNSNAVSIVAVYSVAAPGGFWNNADNGTYTITVVPGAVKDSGNNTTPLAQAQFEVDISSTNAVADPEFNGGSPISSGFVAEAMTTDALGRVLVAGRQGDRAAGTSQSVLQRLNSDGSLDTFFGQGGQIISFPNDNDGFFAVTVDEKQRIVAAGFRAGELEVVRYTAKGKLDKSFGQGGIVLADWGGTDDTIYAVAALPGASVLIAGTSNGNLAFGRLDAKGNIDTSFGQGGATLLKPGGQNGAIGAIKVLSDGTVVAAGTVGTTVALVKLGASGGVDSGFGTGGVQTLTGLAVRTDLGRQDHTVGLAVSREGKMIVGSRSAGGDFAIRRLNGDGSADNTFSGDSLATIDMGGDDDVDFIGLQGTGQIAVVGTTDTGGATRQIAIAALKSDGTLDSSFSSGGKFTADSSLVTSSGASGPFVLRASGAMQTDGRLVMSVGEAFGKATSSPVRRILMPGSGILGFFGNVGGKNVKLSVLKENGTQVTLSLKNAAGEALWDGSVLDLILTGTTTQSALTVTATNGDKRVMIRDLRTDGDIKLINAKAADFVGTCFVAGAVTSLQIGSLSGTLAVESGISALTVLGNISGAFVLSGINLGSDARIGGATDAADTYGAGQVAKLSVKGQVTATFIGAGVDPVNGTFGDSGDVVVGGTSSLIGAVSVKTGVNDSTIFAAGAFGATAKIPQKVVPTLDPHFRILSA